MHDLFASILLVFEAELLVRARTQPTRLYQHSPCSESATYEEDEFAEGVTQTSMNTVRKINL